MPVSDTQIPASAKTVHKAMFQREFKAAMALEGWQTITAMPPTITGGDRTTDHWMGRPPKAANINTDPLPISGLSKYEHTIITYPMAAAIEVERVAIEDDRLGLIGPRVQSLAMSQEYDIGEAVLEQLNGNPMAYDGVSLFSTSRTIGDSGTINNALTGSAGGTPTAPTVAAFQSALSTGRATMAAYADERGRKENQRPNVLVVPAGMEQVAFTALAGSAYPGQSNPVVPSTTRGVWSAGTYTVFTNPISDNGAEMFMINTNGIERPLIFQLRQEVGLEIDESDWIRKEVALYKARGRWGVGVGEPRTIIRFTFT